MHVNKRRDFTLMDLDEDENGGEDDNDQDWVEDGNGTVKVDTRRKKQDSSFPREADKK